jgi:hypothetical protein
MLVKVAQQFRAAGFVYRHWTVELCCYTLFSLLSLFWKNKMTHEIILLSVCLSISDCPSLCVSPIIFCWEDCCLCVCFIPNCFRFLFGPCRINGKYAISSSQNFLLICKCMLRYGNLQKNMACVFNMYCMLVYRWSIYFMQWTLKIREFLLHSYCHTWPVAYTSTSWWCGTRSTVGRDPWRNRRTASPSAPHVSRSSLVVKLYCNMYHDPTGNCILIFQTHYNLTTYKFLEPITVAARSKVWTAFARWNAGIVGSNPTQSMDVCMCVYSVFVLFFV